MSVFGVLFVLAMIGACWVPRDPNKALFIGALIGAGAALFGGKKDRDAQKEANAANRPVNQVAEWEAAGINPAFGISSGGYIPHQAAAVGDSYARAGAIFGDAVNQRHAEKIAQSETKKENTRLKKELDKLAKPSEPSGFQTYSGVLPLPGIADVNTQSGTVTADRLRFPKVERPFEVKAGSGGVDYAGNPVTDISTIGGRLEVDERLSDAEVIEMRYGDIVQEAAGVGNLFADTWKTTQPMRDDWVRRKAANLSSAEQREKDRWEVIKQDKRNEIAARRAAGLPAFEDQPYRKGENQKQRFMRTYYPTVFD